MRLKDLARIVDAEVIMRGEHLDCEIHQAFAADLMSDVLAFASEGSLLLTGLINPQVIRTAEMIDIVAVILARAKVPLGETIELAEKKGIPLLTTKCILFEACGQLYRAGIHGSVEKVD